MNVSMIISSLKYMNSSFDLIVSLAFWIYQEISIINYTDEILVKLLRNKHIDIAESIIHLNKNKKSLDNLFIIFCSMDSIYTDKTICKIIKLLIKNDVDIHTNNEDALSTASYNGNSKIVKILIKAGADIHANNNISLLSATMRNSSIETIRLLLEAGADVHVYDDMLLTCSCIYNRILVVELLLKYGADVHAQNDKAIKVTSYNQYEELKKILLEYY